MPVSAHDIAAELRVRYPGLPVKKLHKLLYYCQAHHLVVFGDPLFAETIEAWDMGPVVAELWRAEKRDTPPSPRQALGERELNTIGYTLSRYGSLTGKDLEVLSHGEDPWLTADRDRRPGGRAAIEHEWIAAYFRSNASTEGEEAMVDPEVLSQWVRENPRPSAGAARALSRDELVAELEQIEARLAQ